MSATPKTGQISFKAVRGGTPYIYNVYNPDVSGSPITWNLNGAAASTSDDNIIVPEDMYITDLSVVTGIVDTTSLVLYTNGAAKAGYLILWANVVNTLPTRIFPRFTLLKGTKVQLKCA